MQLSMENKLQLLCDILDEHQSNSFGSPNEYAQLERLTASLLAQKDVSDLDIQEVLAGIHQYGKKGADASDCTRHIEDHQDQISRWINTVQQNL